MLSIGIRLLVICARTVFYLTARALRTVRVNIRGAMLLLLRRSPTECMIIAVALLGTIFTILQVSQVWLLPGFKYELSPNENTSINDPVVLWWTTSFGEGNFYKKCGDKRCYFTNLRSNVNHPHLKAILFYASDLEIGDLPIPRGKDVRWGLLHEESPRNNPMLVHESALKLFNYSATFSRYSDVPLTLDALPGEKELLSTDYFLPVEQKNKLLESEKLAPVLYIQTDCDTASDRDSYVEELMKYIEVDSYGACLKNRQLPESLSENYIQKLDDAEFLSFVGQYKFTLAFENAVCDDYITEKLWRPLLVGSVPIYYGSPTFKDWLPNNKSVIAAQDFQDPMHLAEYLHELNNNDQLYNEYLAHKLSKPELGITNQRLLNELRARPTDLHSLFSYFIRKFECVVCEKVHDTQISTMTTKQYDCPLPKNILPSQEYKLNPWTHSWMMRKCAAKLLVHHVETGTKIDVDRFEENVFHMYQKSDCS